MNEKKTAEEGVINAIENLAYKCIQWGDGELTGYDSQMLSSLLPIILKPLTEETAAIREENERLKEAVKELIEIADEYVTIYEVRERNAYPHYKDEYKRCQERIENAKKLTGK